MDGSNAAFLLDEPLFSLSPRPVARGILYIEDFDMGLQTEVILEPVMPAAPALTADDVETARMQGREEGLQSALGDAQVLQAQLHDAALQSLTDVLAAARATLESVAARHAGELAHTLLAVLHAAIPATMRVHAAFEVDAVIKALLPGLMSAPELRVRTHPDRADLVRDLLVTSLPSETCMLCVCADPALDAADIRITWQDGHATRDAAAIWAEITSALAPLGLPSLQEIARG